MSEDVRSVPNNKTVRRRPSFLILFAAVLTLLLIVGTMDISHRHLSRFVTAEEKYIVGLEVAILSILVVEMLVGIVKSRLHSQQMAQLGANLRVTVRIAGYLIASVCVVAILSSNPALGISVGTIVGVVVAFATQSTFTSMLATLVLISTRMVRAGEEISIDQTKGTVLEIGLLYTILAVENDVAYIPNSLMISSTMRRKRRTPDQTAGSREL
jgi:small-conductance mechanosensitive channel